MRPRQTTPPLNTDYLQAAPGHWNYLAWAGFVVAGLAHLALSGLLTYYCLSRFGEVAGILVFNGVILGSVFLFRSGMAHARKRREATASRDREA